MAINNRYPDRFHYPRQRQDYFEGWYFKLVDATRRHVWALIPGIMYGARTADDHSFVQVVRGETGEYYYLSYPASDFAPALREFRLGVGPNQFSAAGLRLALKQPELPLEGNLEFSRVLPWPDTPWNPGSMGFFNYLPRMQCYIQVCAMDMALQGSLRWGQEEVDFTGGRGYIEKNWGRAFPYAWIWVQTNHFSDERASLSCSLAQIPFLGSRFRGFILGLTVDGSFYTFSTINRSRCQARAQGEDVVLTAWNARHLLTVETRAPREGFIELKAPRRGQMIPLLQENLSGRAAVRLASRNGALLYAGTGECAGIEYGGDQGLLLEPRPYSGPSLFSPSASMPRGR